MLPCLIILLVPIISYLLVVGCFRLLKFKSEFINLIASALSVLGVLILAVAPFTLNVSEGFASSREFFSINLWCDSFRTLVTLYLSFAMLFCAYIEYAEKDQRLINTIERYLLLSASFVVVLSANFFTTIVGITLMTLAIIHIGAVNSRENIRGIINFYIRKEISDFFLIVGVMLLALFGKTFDYVDLGEGLEGLGNSLGVMALVLVVLWFLIRLRIFPFVSLKQSFIESIKTPLKAIFICVYLPALVTPFLSFTSLLDETNFSQPILFTLGCLSTFLYGVMALFSIRLKDLLIYFTYAQYGVAIIAISVGAYSDAGIHLVMVSALVLIWFAINKLIEKEGVRELCDLTKLGRRFLKIKVIFAILTLSIAGIPLLGLFGQRSEIVWSIMNSTLGHTGTFLFLIINSICITAIARIFAFLICKRDQHLITNRQYKNWHLVVIGSVLVFLTGLSFLTLPNVIIPGNASLFLESFRNDFIEGRILFSSNTTHYVLIAIDQLLCLSIFGGIYFMVRTNKIAPLERVGRKLSILTDYYQRYCHYSDESLRKTTAGIQYTAKVIFQHVDEKIFSKLSAPVERGVIYIGRLNKWSVTRFENYIDLITLGLVLFIFIILFSFIIVGL